MASSPALPDDLTGRSLRELTAREIEVGTTMLGDAWNIIVALVPTVSARVDAAGLDSPYTSAVVRVQVAMTLRVLNNPEGRREAHGDDFGYTIDSSQSTGQLYLTADERATLSVGDNVSETAFTIRPGR